MYWGTSPTKYVRKKPLSRFNLISNNTQVYFSTLIKMFNQYLKLSVGYFYRELYEAINTQVWFLDCNSRGMVWLPRPSFTNYQYLYILPLLLVWFLVLSWHVPPGVAQNFTDVRGVYPRVSPIGNKKSWQQYDIWIWTN